MANHATPVESTKRRPREGERGLRGRGSRVERGTSAAHADPGACAVGYLRRSTDRQEQSIGDQRAAVERYAAEIGVPLVRFYIDDAISGTSTAGRKAFQGMIEDAGSAERGFGMVIVYDVKRFGRIDNDEAGYYRHLLRQRSVEVRYASEGFTGDSTDDLLRPVKQWQARQESKDLAKVVIRGLVSKAGAAQDEGQNPNASWMGGAAPFGYDLKYLSGSGDFIFVVRTGRDGTKALLDATGAVVRTLARGDTVAVSKRDRCVLVPGEAGRVEAVREIFRMYTEERRGLKAIAGALNTRGVPTARGSEWSERYSGHWAMTTVRAILSNPAYAGNLAWNRRTDARFYRITGDGRAVERGGDSLRRLKPNDPSDWIVIREAHEALVERAVWERAQGLMREWTGRGRKPSGSPSGRAASGAWSGPRAKYLLSGLVRCARCGSRYEGVTEPTGTKQRGGAERASRTAYACGGYIRGGRAVCARGTVAQDAMEAPVIEAVVRFYERYAGAKGRALIDDAVRESLGGEQERLGEEREGLVRRLAEVETITRNLLDTVSTATRTAVERRVIELESERASIEERLGAIDRLTRTAKETRAIAARVKAFVERLSEVMASRDAAERHAALRQCVEGAEYDHAAKKVKVSLRVVPMTITGDGEGPTEAVWVPIA